MKYEDILKLFGELEEDFYVMPLTDKKAIISNDNVEITIKEREDK